MMKYATYSPEGGEVSEAVFDRGRKEVHALIHGAGEPDFASQLRAVEAAAEDVCRRNGVTPVFRRYFLSDAANQSLYIRRDCGCAVSVVQQPPLNGAKVALWLVACQDADFRHEGGGLWTDSRGQIIVGDGDVPSGDTHHATSLLLSRLADMLERRGSSLADGCVRTWFMVHDIDRNYQGVVTGRNEEFARRGLTRDTHFIASTGIGGTPAGGDALLCFNAVCDTRLGPERMKYVRGASHLSPTAEYGVAFERGTYVDYGDRRKVYISGTASIDNKGEVVHPGDITRQTERMIENVRVLLDEAGCGDGDVAHLLVYLRDIADARTVDAIFDRELPDVPRILLRAPVCRPAWLVETECMAIRPLSDSLFAPF